MAAVLLVILAGCRGNELPDGMDEDKVSSAGLVVMSQLTKGEYEEVYDALREDVREQTSADAIEEMMDIATEGRGSFKKVKDSMVTGVTDADEPHAEVYARDHDVAVFDAVDEVLVDVLHAVGGELLVALSVQIARGDDDVRIDVIPILMDNAVCIHLFMTSSG